VPQSLRRSASSRADTQELGGLVGVSSATVSRFDTDNTVVVMAAWGMLGLGRQVGQHLTMTGDNTAALVLKTGRRARIDGYSVATGPIAEIVTELGVTSTRRVRRPESLTCAGPRRR
jgi:hypothetical protein